MNAGTLSMTFLDLILRKTVTESWNVYFYEGRLHVSIAVLKTMESVTSRKWSMVCKTTNASKTFHIVLKLLVSFKSSL